VTLESSASREISDRDDIQTDHSARIAHNSGGYFTAARGFCDNLSRLLIPGSKQAIYARLIMETITAWLADCRKLLVFGSNYQPQKIPVRINAVLAEMEIHLRRLLGPNVDLELKYQWNIPEVIGDPDSLACLFSDLARNASDAMLTVPLPEFRIETSHKEGNVIVRVSDNGCGMNKALCARIASGEPTIATNIDLTSSGLGMGFIRRTIAQFGGRMEIASTPEVGTTFTLFFPIAK
jgi:C4-dicarboxylate-specific signal transduction histidine kinase